MMILLYIMLKIMIMILKLMIISLLVKYNSDLFIYVLLGFALIEAIALFALIIAFLILFMFF